MNPIQLATKHLNTIEKLSEARQLEWKSEKVPSPDAMRSFSCSPPGYMLMVCQANIVDRGVIHEGMAVAVTPQGPLVIRLTPELADKLYHSAAALRN